MTRGRNPKKKSRAQKAEEARAALFQAAAEIVGQYGYRDASISRITQRAKLAQGTFYNYFASRQDIFDQLLPVLGTQMLAHIRERAIAGKTFLQREEFAFRAFFDYLKKVPYFLRILNEAEIAAPQAYAQHLRNVSAGYVRFLQNARRSGEMADLPDEELEALAYVMMAARGYLGLRYAKPHGKHELPEYVLHAYMHLVANGLPGDAKAVRRRSADIRPLRTDSRPTTLARSRQRPRRHSL